MNKLKKSLSVLLTLVMLFTTLCFFVIPETDIEANAATSTATYAGYEYYYPNGTTFVYEWAIAARPGGYVWNNGKAESDLSDKGYTVLGIDLNSGAGGNYIKAGYKKNGTESTAIRDIAFYGAGSPPATYTYNGIVYNLVQIGYDDGKSAGAIDLNKKASGDYIYMYYTTDPKAGPPIDAMDYEEGSVNDSNNICQTSCNWIYHSTASLIGSGADLNKGVSKSDDIFFFYHQTGTKVDTSSMHAAITNAENNYIANSSRYVSVSTLQSAVNSARAIANDYNADGLSCNYDQTAINNATKAINDAINALNTNLTLDANGGALGTGVPSPVAMNVGAGTSVSFNNADVKDAFYATRTGYTFLGWSTDKDATSVPATVTVGFNDTVYAIWDANEYQVVFDNLIDYPAWNKAAGNGTVSDITDNGFTITSNEGVSESTSESPYFPVTPGKKYKVHMDITGTAWDVYIFFCDADGNWVDFADGPSNRYSTGGSTGVDPENAIFTAPDKAEVVKAKIRVDANGSNNTVRFENIRVFEVDNENADISYEAPIMVTYDQPFGTLPTPTRTGYDFRGWVDENGTPYAESTKVSITETLRLYSTWELGTYTITFDTKGGTAIAPVSGHYGDAVTKPADPTKTGYLFTGWDKTVPDTIPPKDTTITATWSENSYAVFFDGNGQTGGTAPTQINTTYTNTFTLPECTYTKNGYTFVGWNTRQDGLGVTYSAGQPLSKLTDVRNDNVTLYAMWDETPYTITYVYDNGTGETKVIPFDISNTLVSLAAPEKTGYTFAGWKVTAAEGSWVMGDTVDEGVTVPEGIMYGNATLTAQWTVNQYTITFDTDDGTAVAPITQDFGTAINEPAAPTKEGYTFAGWDNLPATMPADDITVTAIWTVNEYVVEYNANGGEGNVDSQTFKSTDKVTLRDNAFTKTGYHFIGWAETLDGEVKYEGAASDLPAFTQAAGETITLYAVWEANTYTVTFDKNDAEATGTMDVQSFTYDEAEALSALGFAKVGYDFVGWYTSADCTGTKYDDKAEVINLTAENGGNVTLYAKWTIRLYDVTFKFFDKDGTEFTVTREDIPHGTSFGELVLPSAAEGFIETYYDGAVTSPADNKYHHVFNNTWKNAVPEIVSDITFEAEYNDVAHEYYDDPAAKGATCISTGIKAEYCDCGYRYEEIIPMSEHPWQKTGENVTCTEEGTADYKCSYCGATKQDKTPAPGHTFSAVPEQAPSCTEIGYAAHKVCTKCNLFFAEDADIMAAGAPDKSGFEIGAAGHNNVWIDEVPADCENDGTLGHFYCDKCDKYFDADENELTDLVIKSSGHNYVWNDEVPADCENNGTLGHYHCDKCDKNFDADKNVLSSIVIGAKGHDYGTWIDEVPADCENDGTLGHFHCDKCDKNFDADKNVLSSIVIGAKGHDYGTWIDEVPATCVETGTRGHYECRVCSKYFDANKDQLTNIIIDIDPDKHDLVQMPGQLATCEGIGWNAYEYCQRENCNYTTYVEIPATGHTEAKKQVTITEASCTVAGDYYDITYCSVCDTELTRVEVTGKTLPHSYKEEMIDADHLKSAATCVLYAVYYYDCEFCTANAKNAENKDEYTFEYVAGGFNATNHQGTTTTADEDIVPGTCITEKKWNVVTRCDDCTEIITSVATTGDLDKNNHVGSTYSKETNHVDGTCSSVATWTEITYCADCNAQLGSTAKTGEKDPANHSTNETVTKNNKAATCNEEGYTGNKHCKDCDAIREYGVAIPTTKDNHVGGTRTEKEDTVPGTCMAPETWNDVTYCIGCGDKLSTVAGTGEKDPEKHTGNNTVTVTNEKAATCATPATWTQLTVCECGATVGTEDKTGEKNPDAHTGETYTENTDESEGTCLTEASWVEITYCKGCKKELSRVDKTGEKDPENHTGVTETKAENIVPGTCISERTWNEVTYCECGEKLSTVAKTGEKDPSAHEGTPTKLVGVKAATCKDEGYTGDTLYTCCDVLYAKGSVVPTTDHTPAEAVKENIKPATDTEDGSYESVVYCSVCNHEISRDIVVTRLERTITFVMKDKTVKIISYNGETVEAPVVEDVVGADGFVYKFKKWDKAIVTVNGDATYTAVYTQPCDFTDFDALEETLREVLEDGLADEGILEENKAEIERILDLIDEINSERNTLDKSEQGRVDFVTGEIGNVIDIIYPDAGSTLVIEGASTAYVGTNLNLKAIKMPLGAVLTDVTWVSSDDDIVFFSNGKLFAVGTGTVTLTATRGILKASKVVTIIEGGNVRGINFTSINNTHFIIEDYKAVYNSAIVYWSDDCELRFRVRVYQSFMFEDYIVYINGVEATEDENGYYVIPAGSGDVRVTIAGAVVDGDGSDGDVVTKWSFWEWLLNLFRKIGEFFKGLFG